MTPKTIQPNFAYPPKLPITHWLHSSFPVLHRLSNTLSWSACSAKNTIDASKTPKHTKTQTLTFRGQVMQPGQTLFFLLTYLTPAIVFANKKSPGEFRIELSIDGINPKILKNEAEKTKAEKSKTNNETVGKRNANEHKEVRAMNAKSWVSGAHRIPQIGGFMKKSKFVYRREKIKNLASGGPVFSESSFFQNPVLLLKSKIGQKFAFCTY